MRTLTVALLALLLGWIGTAQAAARNPNGVAVIVGNKTYQHTRVPEVAFAHRDADAIKAYVIDVLGFDPINVIDLRDASRIELEEAFGSAESHKGQLWSYLEPDGGSDVVVYFSGHGVPGQKDRKGYLLPVDANPEFAEVGGYPIARLYANLSKLEVRSVTVMLEACFSGESPRGMLIGKASPVYLTAELPPAGNLTVLTAASGDQLASWDETAQHGLFTNALLDALYGRADRDGNGRVTLSETRSYLKRHLTRNARRTYRREQTASVHGDDGAILAAYAPGAPLRRPTLEPLAQPTPGATAPQPAPAPAPAAPAGTVELEPIDAEFVTLKNANVRAAPSVGGAKVATLARGSRIAVLGKVKGADWYAVELSGGRRAFVYMALLREAGARPAAAPAAPTPTPAPVPSAPPRSARAIVLNNGMTLADWAFLADRRDDHRMLLVEAVQHRKRHGDVPEVLAVLDKALGEELRDVRKIAESDPDQALDRLSRLENAAGPRAPILLLKARALHARQDFAVAAQAYGDWLRQAPHDHPERRKVAAGLFRAQKRETLGPVRGQTFRDCADCPEMVMVPAGSFVMGSPPDEPDRDDDEGPQHRVTVAAFAAGKYEVTRGQWRQFVDEAGYQGGDSCWTKEDGEWKGRSPRSWRRPAFEQDDRHPVVCISWEDAQAYLKWLRGKTGKAYRLLSEAEWEYAARAGSSAAYHWGGTGGNGRLNCSGCDDTWGGKRTAPVGSFPANPFGLHDMLGNVWEWVEDCYHETYGGAPADGSAWVSGGDCGRRVLRGGSWNYTLSGARAAHRLKYTVNDRDTEEGFRVARPLD